MKRKRATHSAVAPNPVKKQKLIDNTNVNTSKPTPQTPCSVSHPVLQHYFPRVLTLRQYLLEYLPAESQRRRRKLERRKMIVGTEVDEMYDLLDSVLIGCGEAVERAGKDIAKERQREDDLHRFSQQLSGSTAGELLGEQAMVTQRELVDFTIWNLFFRTYPCISKPPHILCHGWARATATYENGLGISVGCSIPGLNNMFINEHVESMKSQAWADVMALLGKDGFRFMMGLILECGVFVPVMGPKGSLYQLSGTPLSDMRALSAVNPSVAKSEARGPLKSSKTNAAKILQRPSQIRFVRHRMLYARAVLNAKGSVAFGLRHIHVFNRYSDATNLAHTTHIMKYIFPRQFGLHNVFTSKPDPKETAQTLKDYTLREQEISRLEYMSMVGKSPEKQKIVQTLLPKRLRDQCLVLMRRLQRLHNRCSYTKLLAHYCPAPLYPSSPLTSEVSTESAFMTFATNVAQVSAFCRAVVSNVFPRHLLGDAEVADTNWKILLYKIDLFVRTRRFESLTLDSVMDGMKVKDIAWLQPPKIGKGDKMCLSDYHKRREIFAELIYYIFDSFLIPLLRSNFHITESSTHKNRLFYFRHDVWRRLTEPAMANLKTSMLEDMEKSHAMQILNQRNLGFSQIRLVPKEVGMRPISNLKRRAQVVLNNGSTILGASINSILKPAFSALNYEKTRQASKLGASMFSVNEMFPKLRAFHSAMSHRQLLSKKLYFVKVDVKSCFDSIPQDQVLQLAQNLLSADEYAILNHSELNLNTLHRASLSTDKLFIPSKRYYRNASAVGDGTSFLQLARNKAGSRRQHTVFVDGVVPQHVSKENVTQLLNQHINANIVRIGKKYYRQKQGIPQGSVLSSLLCNFFYGDFESNHLDFLAGDECALFRLIDDFLLVTTEKAHALRFLNIMHDGVPGYGISIKQEKTLVNFDAEVGGKAVMKVADGGKFPYCGMLVDTRTLNISKDQGGFKVGKLTDSLTIEYTRTPGQIFRRKMLSALKIQMHTMLLDTSFNSLSTVLRNIHNCMNEVAAKSLLYLRGLRRGGEGREGKLLVDLVQDLSSLAFATTRSRSKRHNHTTAVNNKTSISKATIYRITLTSFLSFYIPQQTKFRGFVAWLLGELGW